MNGPPRYGHAGWLFSASKLLSFGAAKHFVLRRHTFAHTLGLDIRIPTRASQSSLV